MNKIMAIGIWAFLIINTVYTQTVVPPQEAVNVAHDHFADYLTSVVSEDTKTIVGFDADDDLKRAVLGAPFKLYTLPVDAITDYNGESKLSSMLQETDRWYFPIMIGNVVKMMLYVGKRNGLWERAGLGSAGLAREMQCLLTQYSLKKGFAPLLVQQRNTGNYLFSIPQVDAYNLTEAFTSPANTNPRRYANLEKLTTTILELRERKELRHGPVR